MQLDGGYPGLEQQLNVKFESDGTLNIAMQVSNEIVVISNSDREDDALARGRPKVLQDGWTEEIVYEMGKWPRIVVGEDGIRHLAWQNAMTNDILYADDASGSWVVELVDDGADGATPSPIADENGLDGAELGLALDPDGFVHIAYKNEQDMQILHATNRSGTWVTKKVWDIEQPHKISSFLGICSSVAIVPSGAVHIATSGIVSLSGTKRQYFFSNATGSWELDDTLAALNCGPLVVDGSGQLHTAGRLGADGLNYLTRGDDEWIPTFVDENGKEPSLHIDSASTVRLLYQNSDGQNPKLRLATSSSDEWTYSDIYANDEDGMNPDLYAMDVDAKGFVHAVSLDGRSGRLLYSKNSSSSWSTSTIRDESEVYRIAVAADDAGRAHIAYQHTTGLRYALVENGVAKITQLDAADMNLGHWIESGSIQIGQDDAARILYVERGEPNLLKLATQTEGGWDIEILPVSGSVSSSHGTAFALNDDGKVFIVCSTESKVNFLSNSSGEWQIEEILDRWGRIYDVSVTLTGEVHAVLRPYELVYARRSSDGEWTIEPIVDEHGVDGASMRTDADGVDHVAYTGLERFPILYYATNRTGEWVSEKAAEAVLGTSAPRLLLDDDARPIIYYLVDTPAGAWQSLHAASTTQGGQWQSVTIDPTVSFYDVAMDQSGRRHIANGSGAAIYTLLDPLTF
ncbi:MAG: hypothetical protein H6683_03315 [Deltaproteobacteria bacterium]|nr:hypothetical protein [Deltaproteobacteria bacterium]